MNKYNEIMNHIEMDDERRSRILEGINLQLENKITETEEKSEKKTSGISVKWIVAASIAASVLIIAIPLNFFRIDPDNPDGPTIEMPEETTTVSVTFSESEENISVTDTKPDSDSAFESSEPVTVPTKIITQGSNNGQTTAEPTRVPSDTLPLLTDISSDNPTTTEEPPFATPPVIFTQYPDSPETTLSPEITESPEPYEYAEYDTLEELNAATGYNISHLPWLPFEADDIYYESYDNKASISYTSDTEGLITLTKSAKRIIEPEFYELTETVTVSETDVTLYITDEQVCAAQFHTGTYFLAVNIVPYDNPELGSREIVEKIISVFLNQ